MFPKTYLIKNSRIINEGKIFSADVLLKDGLIHKIADHITDASAEILDAKEKYLMPGVIDDQVHFREPGLTHKGNIYSESRAAVAGGITSFMEMPNTVPNTLTQELLEEKYAIGAKHSLANFSFFMGASNDNLDEVKKTDPKKVCGVKVFMGSSTGNMLVDSEKTLEGIFSECDMLIATHCEDEPTVRKNLAAFKAQYGDDLTVKFHPLIRNVEACYLSSSRAVSLAKKYKSRLHILHISTEKELSLFDNDIPLAQKRITAEACVHHLWFCDEDYESKGNFIKWNPAIKSRNDRDAILQGVLENRIDILATDHAPHTLEEKQKKYSEAPSGGPLVQHALVAMMELSLRNTKSGFSLEKMVEKMCHAPADCFHVNKRGYIREGYHADVVLVEPSSSWTVTKENILYKCGWSPFEGTTFQNKVTHTFVNGHLAYDNGIFNEAVKGQRLDFQR